MSASDALKRLYSLDTSSPDFSRVLYGLIRHDEDEQYSSSLEGEELVRLMDFLDDVRPLPPALRPVANRTPQALGTIPTSDDIFRQCLRKLRAICGYHTTLPSSHIVCGDLARIGDGPIAFGGFADVWQGTHGGREVCIKSLRVSLNDDESLTKVRTRHRRVIPLFTEYRSMGAIVILQGGCRVETVKAPKCRSFSWCHKQTFTTCVGVDAKRNFNALRQEQSGRGSDLPGKPFLRNWI
jgi:hypothetical protein